MHSITRHLLPVPSLPAGLSRDRYDPARTQEALTPYSLDFERLVLRVAPNRAFPLGCVGPLGLPEVRERISDGRGTACDEAERAVRQVGLLGLPAFFVIPAAGLFSCRLSAAYRDLVGTFTGAASSMLSKVSAGGRSLAEDSVHATRDIVSPA